MRPERGTEYGTDGGTRHRHTPGEGCAPRCCRNVREGDTEQDADGRRTIAPRGLGHAQGAGQFARLAHSHGRPIRRGGGRDDPSEFPRDTRRKPAQSAQPQTTGARTCAIGGGTGDRTRCNTSHCSAITPPGRKGTPEKIRTAQYDCILNIAHRKITRFRRQTSHRTHMCMGRHSFALARALNILPDIESYNFISAMAAISIT